MTRGSGNSQRNFGHHDDDLDDVFGVYRTLRERCPVGHSERYGGFWFVAKYEDIYRAEQDPNTFSVTPACFSRPSGTSVR
jgi:cytochrome P450